MGTATLCESEIRGQDFKGGEEGRRGEEESLRTSMQWRKKRSKRRRRNQDKAGEERGSRWKKQETGNGKREMKRETGNGGCDCAAASLRPRAGSRLRSSTIGSEPDYHG